MIETTFKLQSYKNWVKNGIKTDSALADPGFFKGVGWYLEVAESMGHLPEML